MSGETPKDVRQDAADVDADETEPARVEKGAAGARPAARRKRRVRVIEVLDDEDLDEVLDAIDEEEDRTPPESRQKSLHGTERTTERTTERATAGTAEPPERSAEPRERKEPVSLDRAEGQTFLGMGRVPAVVVVVLVAALASLGIWQWWTIARLAHEKEERAAVAKVAAAYGDVALNYNASNYQTQMQKAQALMAGDLLDSFKTNTLPNLGNTFRQNPQLVLTSKTDQVFVGSVDERFATAAISVNVSLRTTEGVNDSPATLIRLSLAKIDGRWKVTEQYSSGVNEQNKDQQGGLPTTPASPGASPSPSGSSKD
ncbi:hypothetical protein Acsp03_60430 [Actinomadura sp. NBRC 104412]|uniref:hypothetical protein n=1 Tax=Actinomadura sp. NBRC 104412 TaxID=3032203 RepID=UPI0024A53BCD|nr:hypothetical protein [Actinomadura sp. NBRC 104412]GLZ08577.1 hypothetical protein Acsp03_60430 [Actinomadura sp. NBRC 104412]